MLDTRETTELKKADNVDLFISKTDPIFNIPLDTPISIKNQIEITLCKKTDENQDNSKYRNGFYDTYFKIVCKNVNIFDDFVKKCEYQRNINTAMRKKEYYKMFEYSNSDDSSKQWVKKNINIHKSFDNTFLPGGTKDKVMKILDNFIDPNSADKRNKYGIPHKLGFLLYGLRGCGKSALVYAVANYTMRNIYKINLNDVTNLEKAFDMVSPGNIVFIEEIDTISFTNKRKKHSYAHLLRDKSKETIEGDNDKDDESSSYDGHVSDYAKDKLGTLLCILDGYHCLENTIIFMTTNHKDHLDDALIRPGRIDHHIEFSRITEHQIKTIIEYYYDDKSLKKIIDQYDEFMDKLIGNITTSTFINSFIIHNTSNCMEMASEIMECESFVN